MYSAINLADKSYIEGYVRNRGGSVRSSSRLPPAHLCRALRWQNHIMQDQKASLVGGRSFWQVMAPWMWKTTKEVKVENKDDDTDLFGSDDEEESEEAKKL